MNKFKQFFIGGQNFRKEFLREIRMLIVVTLGFTIAFSWRQTTFDLTESLVVSIFKTSASVSSLLTSTFITLFSIIVIFMLSHFIKED